MSKQDEVVYSEIFHSFQGEALRTGHSTVWLRYATCNLQCDGFGQKDPTDRATYELPYQEIDIGSIKRVEDLPVFKQGCDSSYTWSKKYQHLMQRESAAVVASRLIDIWRSVTSSDKEFLDLAFTGGEPLLKANQRHTIAIMKEIEHQTEGAWSPTVTFETNGTQSLLPETEQFFNDYYSSGAQIIFSVSPKLFTVSGEKTKKAIKPEVVSQYRNVGFTYLKFVVSNTSACLKELEETIDKFGREYYTYLMPVGATNEQQKEDHVKDIALYCMKKNYIFCPRVHCEVFGNVIGT